MRNKLFFLVIIGTLLLFVGCNNEVLNEDGFADKQTGLEKTLSITAQMPGGEPATRVSLTPDVNQTILKWEVGNQIHLLFMQASTSTVKKQVVTVSNISADGKNATFSVTLPDEITDGEFDLYGVHGGGGLLESDPTKLILPVNVGDAASLESIAEQNHVVLHFAKESIQIDNPDPVNVNFQHLGSLFNISIINSSPATLQHLKEIRLTSDTEGWAYNSGADGNTFDLLTKEFSASEGTDNHISFSVDNINLNEQILSFWGWYPPTTAWPELRLELINTEDGSIAVSGNTKSARTSTLETGKNYTFYAKWNGTELEFTNEPFNIEMDKELWENALVSNDHHDVPTYRNLSDLWTPPTATSYFRYRPSTAEIPNWFTIDLGKRYYFGKILVNQHLGGDWRFGKDSPKIFEIWASNEKSTNWDDWTRLGEFEIIKPSGLPYKSLSTEDVTLAAIGSEFNFPYINKSFQYVRFKTLETWGIGVSNADDKGVMLRQLTLWGLAAE